MNDEIRIMIRIYHRMPNVAETILFENTIMENASFGNLLTLRLEYV